jgi:ubiquinone/menaquinone biosynthesis C-methylase UbiE
MPFYRDRVYPHLVNVLGDPQPIHEVRRRIIPLAEGNVLEISAGSGANFLHYDPGKVRTLYALEPNAGMRRLAERQGRRTGMAIEYLDLPGERILLEEQSMDTIVSTFALCTIPGVVEAISGIRRVLRSSGTLIFFEMMHSPDPAVRRWQQWWEPLHHRVYAGLYLTRDIPDLLTEGGFKIERMDTAYLARFPKSWTYCCWGTALPDAH